MKYRVSLENLYSGHVASPWLELTPELIVTYTEDNFSWWKAEDFFACTGTETFEITSIFKDGYLEEREEELLKCS